MDLGDALRRALPEEGYGPGDIILVVDTSFLIALSNRHLWAYDAILKMEHAARGKTWEWRAPLGVNRQYNGFLNNKTVEKDTKIPLAHHTIDDLLNVPRYMGILVDSRTPVLARDIWEGGPEGPREAGEVDFDVIQFAVGIAQSGADVYVASSDFKDIIRPLENQSEQFQKYGGSITLLAPSEINSQYWIVKGQELPIRATLTGKVISELQDVQDSNEHYHVIVFEKNVKSGNATFDAGVGVAEKMYLRSFKLPQEYASIREKYRLVPVVKVKSLQDEKSMNNVGQSFKDLNVLELVVVEESQPYFPTLVTVFRYTRRLDLPLYRADPDFLYWQTDSEFARAKHTPVRKG